MSAIDFIAALVIPGAAVVFVMLVFAGILGVATRKHPKPDPRTHDSA